MSAFVRTALLLGAAPAAWATHFLAAYGITGLACARGMEAIVPWAIGALTLAAAAGCALLLRHAMRRREGFEHGLAAMLAVAALVAISWQALPVLLVEHPCG